MNGPHKTVGYGPLSTLLAEKMRRGRLRRHAALPVQPRRQASREGQGMEKEKQGCRVGVEKGRVLVYVDI